MDKISKVLKIVGKYDASGSSDVDFLQVKSAITSSVSSNQPITFINFTCSTINSEYMFNSKSPELYVSLDPKGNNLENDLPKLTKFYLELCAIYPVKIIILIGNTDPFYIYTEEAKKLKGVSQKVFFKKFSKRWKLYKNNLKKYIQSSYPNLACEVISWYELENNWKKFGCNFQFQFKQIYPNITKLFDNSDFEWEFKKLNQAFGEGKYFDNLSKPPDSTLRVWVKRKFTEYSIQGLWIKQIFPNSILLQNEKPSDLRTKMYQPLIRKFLNSRLPVLYPYGIDNSGYQ